VTAVDENPRVELRRAVVTLRHRLEEQLDLGIPLARRDSATAVPQTRQPEPPRTTETGQLVIEPPPATGPFDGWSLEQVRAEAEKCTRCPLHTTRHTVVFGVGDPTSNLMFVGEAPGHDEDLQGEPFVGRAGQLLTKIIEAMGQTRDTVYICNVLKCRPPENRNPLPAEVQECQPFLLRQVEMVSPKVIVGLGTYAVKLLLGTEERISRLRGRFHDMHGVAVMPTYHPAFLLRNPNAKRDVWDDMKLVVARLRGEG